MLPQRPHGLWKRFFTLFLTNLLIFIPLFIAEALLFLLQMVFPGEFTAILFFAAGIVLAFVPYAVVAGGRGPIDAIKESYALFNENRFQTTLMYVFTYYFQIFSIYGVTLACMTAFSLCLFFLPNISAGDLAGYVSALMPSTGVIAGGLLLALLVYVLAEALIISPLIALFWTTYYMSKTGHRRAAG